MKMIRIVSLCIMAFMLFVNVDLGLNYLNATFIDLNDGIVCISFFKPLFGDSQWSLWKFFNAFSTSLWITLFIVMENIILSCIMISNKNCIRGKHNG